MGFGVEDVKRCSLMSKFFNPYAPSNLSSSARAIIYRIHENLKKHSNEAQIHEVEHGLFTPLIFSATGGMTDEAYSFYKHLASLLSDKWDEHYIAASDAMDQVLFVLNFALLYSACEVPSHPLAVLAVLCWRLWWSLYEKF